MGVLSSFKEQNKNLTDRFLIKKFKSIDKIFMMKLLLFSLKSIHVCVKMFPS